jgi:hypothetical protein
MQCTKIVKGRSFCNIQRLIFLTVFSRTPNWDFKAFDLWNGILNGKVATTEKFETIAVDVS